MCSLMRSYMSFAELIRIYELKGMSMDKFLLKYQRGSKQALIAASSLLRLAFGTGSSDWGK
jgi:hypothetical protein